jgi:surface carbohydrate biosynthesis protein
MKPSSPYRALLLLKLLLKPGAVRFGSAPKAKTVIYGEVYAQEIASLLKDRTSLIFDPTYKKKLFFFTFVFAALRWLASGRSHSITHYYFLAFLRSSKADMVVTAVDHSSDLYSARRSLPQTPPVSFVVFQNGIRWIRELPKTSSLRSNDIFFSLTDRYASEWSQRAPAGAKIVPLGTLLSKINDEIGSAPLVTSKAAFISAWRQGQLIDGVLFKSDRSVLVPHYEFYRPEIELLPHLANSLGELGLTLEILGASNNPEEQSFYRSILGDTDWSFSPKDAETRSYQKLARYPVIFCTDSTLGYEALASSKRVMFLDTELGGSMRFPFGYPAEFGFASCPLRLRSKDQSSWGGQIKSILQMQPNKLQLLAASIVGERALNAKYSDIARYLDSK